jgi:isopentenyl-diphosphate delta-isomerase
MKRPAEIAETGQEHRIVSSEAEELILVDDNDQQIGVLDKGLCHDGDGVRHRAFSLFLFNSLGQLLLQQRAADKRLWPMYWSNSCCSHPRRGESMDVATRRRLAEELNTSASLEFVYKFSYQARFGEEGSENELCSVYLGRCTTEPLANRNEIEAVRFVDKHDLARELSESPESFTPWFKMEWDRLNNEYGAVLAPYTASG